MWGEMTTYYVSASLSYGYVAVTFPTNARPEKSIRRTSDFCRIFDDPLSIKNMMSGRPSDATQAPISVRHPPPDADQPDKTGSKEKRAARNWKL